MIVKLYTKQGCHLCENAKAIIIELKEHWEFHFEEVDIYQNDKLLEKYGLMIPVIEIDGEITQYGQIDKKILNEAFTKRKH